MTLQCDDKCCIINMFKFYNLSIYYTTVMITAAQNTGEICLSKFCGSRIIRFLLTHKFQHWANEWNICEPAKDIPISRIYFLNFPENSKFFAKRQIYHQFHIENLLLKTYNYYKNHHKIIQKKRLVKILSPQKIYAIMMTLKIKYAKWAK